MQSIEEYQGFSDITIDSPIKYLQINFTNNSLIIDKTSDCESSNYENQPGSYILFPYRNE